MIVIPQDIHGKLFALPELLDRGIEVTGHIRSGQMIAILGVDNAELQLGIEGLSQELVQLRHFVVLEGGQTAQDGAVVALGMAEELGLFADLEYIKQQVVGPGAVLRGARTDPQIGEVIVDDAQAGGTDAGQVFQNAGQAAAVKFVQLRVVDAVAVQNWIGIFHQDDSSFMN